LGSRLALGKNVRPYLKKKAKRAGSSGRMLAQAQCPKFKPQYHIQKNPANAESLSIRTNMHSG
jgi:hypothetical protein